MSFREVRSFVEKMRVLGYPQPISMESFRAPNFDLVADILYWLAKRYDQNMQVLYDISSEQERIIFIKTIAALMASNAHIKLNTRKLYTGDGYAVKELLKIANLLYEAARTPLGQLNSDSNAPSVDIADKLSQIKICRALASSLTEKGSGLHEILGKEVESRALRDAVLAKPLELKTMETAVSDAINHLEMQMTTMKTTIDNLSSDENNLMAKIDKKRNELDRAEKRLKSLQGVRPAYMDEYEKIEGDLIKLYDKYMERFRNLTFLEQQIDEYNRDEQDKADENDTNLKRMQERIREEELRLLRGNASQEILSEDAPEKLKRPIGAGKRGQSFNDTDDDEDDNPDKDDVSIGSGLSSSTSGIPANEPGRDFLDSDGEGDMARPSHPMADEDDSHDDIQFDDEDDEDVDDDDF